MLKQLLAISLITMALTVTIPVAAETAPPNVVVIISDDHMWTDYGFMGHKHVQTPHIDRLAKEGLTFSRGYVPSSLCCPSLATIITGLYPHQHKVTSNDPPPIAGKPKKEWFEVGRTVMNEHMKAVPTLPRVLSERGYLSLQTGKWWQGHYSHGGFTHGMTQGGRHGDAGLDIGRKTMKPIDDFITVAKTEKKPFFIWYAPFMPHTPHTPPERLLNKYKDKDPSLHVAKYWAMIDWFDETIGQLREQLATHGVADNTIIIYVADNGWIQDNKSGKYAEKSKQSQYDGGLRTPIIVHWPASVTPRMANELAHSIDIYPTIMAAIKAPVPENLPGINLLDETAVKARTTIYGEIFTHDSQDLQDPAKSLRWRWLISGQQKLIVPDAKNQPKNKIELYDLGADPLEEKDIAAENADTVKTLSAQLDAWWKPE